MAGLHTKGMHVEVFVSPLLCEVVPDVVEDMQAVTETFAVQQVMSRHRMDMAGVVYIALEGGAERWLYEVRLVGGQVTYAHSVGHS